VEDPTVCQNDVLQWTVVLGTIETAGPVLWESNVILLSPGRGSGRSGQYKHAFCYAQGVGTILATRKP